MKIASQQDFFPYNAKTVCYILVPGGGEPKQVLHTQSELQTAYDAVLSGAAKLYAVWPGRYSSDLFRIDDLNAFADAFGIAREDAHVHELKWKYSDQDDGRSRYASICCQFLCGCQFHEISIKKLANDLQKQKGWTVATSKGKSGFGSRFFLSVLRSDLKDPDKF